MLLVVAVCSWLLQHWDTKVTCSVSPKLAFVNFWVQIISARAILLRHCWRAWRNLLHVQWKQQRVELIKIQPACPLRAHLPLLEKNNSGGAVVWKLISEPARFASITTRHSSAQCKHSVPPPWVGKVGQRKLADDSKWKYSRGHSGGPALHRAL